MKVSARERGAARREALEAVLPLFVTEAGRRAHAEAVEAVLADPAGKTGRERVAPKGDCVVEVRVAPLAAALAKTGAVVPPGFEAGPEIVLIAFGDRAFGPDGRERLAADALETALFGRGVQAVDADDKLVELKHPLKGKSEDAIVAEAAKGGWAWMVSGRAAAAAERDASSGAWRGTATLTVAARALPAAGDPERFSVGGSAVDVSSEAAVSRALEQAAQETAVRVQAAMLRAHAGRATLGVLISGRKDPAYLRRVIGDLRRTPGIVGASLTTWSSLDGMVLIHAYAKGLKADELAARLLRDDSSLRVDAIETEDGRLTLQGPEIPASEDRGE